MAFTGYSAGVVLRSALGVISRAQGILSENAITRQVMNAVTTLGQRTYQEYQGIVRQAIRVSYAGSQVTLGGATAVPRNLLPVDPSIQAGEPLYRYRVAVTAMGDTGDTLTTVATIDSDTPMSQAQLTAQVSQDVESHTSDRRSVRASVAALGNPVAVEVVTISAGRRRP